MRALPTASLVFTVPSACPLLWTVRQCPREDDAHQEKHQDALITTDAVEELSNLKEDSGLRKKKNMLSINYADTAEMGWYSRFK